MELASGVIVELMGGFSSLLMVASCSNNEIVDENYGVLGAVVAIEHQSMVPIFIFNFNNFQPLHHLYFRIIT